MGTGHWRTRRKTLKVVAGAAGVGAAWFGGFLPRPAAAETYFRIGTGGTSGTYFPIGGLIANAISNPPGSRACNAGGSCGVPGLVAVAQSSAGSIDNIRAIAEGRIESGFSQADIAFWAYSGMLMFAEQGPVANLRAIANLYRESVQLVARADAGIAAVGDLVGKRVSMDEEGSGTLVDARAILAAFGVDEAELAVSFQGAEEAADAMLAGELDAFFIIAGAPTPSVADLAEQLDVVLVPINGEPLTPLLREQPFFARDFVSHGIYRGIGTVETLTVGALWVVAAEVPEELVFGITQALWHDNTRRLLDAGHAVGKEIQLASALTGVPLPLHPGAERYYRETGVLQAP